MSTDQPPTPSAHSAALPAVIATDAPALPPAPPPPIPPESPPVSSSSAPPPPPVQQPAPRSGGLWLASLALLLAVGALVAAGMLWQKVGFTQQEMARRSQDSAAQSVEARTLASQAEALTNELQARLAVAEVKLSEVTLQRSQLEELMLSLSRSRDDNLVQDIDSALRLAMQQTQLTGSSQPLISALQAADQRIARAAQPRLNPVQRAIARDVERIQTAATTDVPSLVRQLDELVRQVDSWPVPNEWRGKPPQSPVGPQSGAAVAADANGAVSATAAKGWAQVTQVWRAFWTRVWKDVTQSGRELVRVSRIDRPEAALVAPEQVFFLRENIKLRLLNARLGLLARQMEQAQGDLLSTEQALGRYFDLHDPAVASALRSLDQLRTEMAKSELPRPDESLAALATAAGGR
ncbi:MAG: uroporphyrinogen-III C-methyltransferase [Burkholderiaceae bacterium]